MENIAIPPVAVGAAFPDLVMEPPRSIGLSQVDFSALHASLTNSESEKSSSSSLISMVDKTVGEKIADYFGEPGDDAKIGFDIQHLLEVSERHMHEKAIVDLTTRSASQIGSQVNKLLQG